MRVVWLVAFLAGLHATSAYTFLNNVVLSPSPAPVQVNAGVNLTVSKTETKKEETKSIKSGSDSLLNDAANKLSSLFKADDTKAAQQTYQQAAQQQSAQQAVKQGSSLTGQTSESNKKDDTKSGGPSSGSLLGDSANKLSSLLKVDDTKSAQQNAQPQNAQQQSAKQFVKQDEAVKKDEPKTGNLLNSVNNVLGGAAKSSAKDESPKNDESSKKDESKNVNLLNAVNNVLGGNAKSDVKDESPKKDESSRKDESPKKDESSKKDESKNVNLNSINNVLGGAAKLGVKDESPKKDESSRKDESPKKDESSRKDESPKKDESSRKDESPKKDESSRKDESPKKDESSRKDESPKKDESSRKDESPKKDESSRKDESPKKDESSRKDESPKKDESSRKDEPRTGNLLNSLNNVLGGAANQAKKDESKSGSAGDKSGKGKQGITNKRGEGEKETRTGSEGGSSGLSAGGSKDKEGTRGGNRLPKKEGDKSRTKAVSRGKDQESRDKKQGGLLENVKNILGGSSRKGAGEKGSNKESAGLSLDLSWGKGKQGVTKKKDEGEKGTKNGSEGRSSGLSAGRSRDKEETRGGNRLSKKEGDKSRTKAVSRGKDQESRDKKQGGLLENVKNILGGSSRKGAGEKGSNKESAGLSLDLSWGKGKQGVTKKKDEGEKGTKNGSEGRSSGLSAGRSMDKEGTRGGNRLPKKEGDKSRTKAFSRGKDQESRDKKQGGLLENVKNILGGSSRKGAGEKGSNKESAGLSLDLSWGKGKQGVTKKKDEGEKGTKNGSEGRSSGLSAGRSRDKEGTRGGNRLPKKEGDKSRTKAVSRGKDQESRDKKQGGLLENVKNILGGSSRKGAGEKGSNKESAGLSLDLSWGKGKQGVTKKKDEGEKGTKNGSEGRSSGLSAGRSRDKEGTRGGNRLPKKEGDKSRTKAVSRGKDQESRDKKQGGLLENVKNILGGSSRKGAGEKGSNKESAGLSLDLSWGKGKQGVTKKKDEGEKGTKNGSEGRSSGLSAGRSRDKEGTRGGNRLPKKEGDKSRTKAVSRGKDQESRDKKQGGLLENVKNILGGSSRKGAGEKGSNKESAGLSLDLSWGKGKQGVTKKKDEGEKGTKNGSEGRSSGLSAGRSRDKEGTRGGNRLPKKEGDKSRTKAVSRGKDQESRDKKQGGLLENVKNILGGSSRKGAGEKGSNKESAGLSLDLSWGKGKQGVTKKKDEGEKGTKNGSEGRSSGLSAGRSRDKEGTRGGNRLPKKEGDKSRTKAVSRGKDQESRDKKQGGLLENVKNILGGSSRKGAGEKGSNKESAGLSLDLSWGKGKQGVTKKKDEGEKGTKNGSEGRSSGLSAGRSRDKEGTRGGNRLSKKEGDKSRTKAVSRGKDQESRDKKQGGLLDKVKDILGGSAKKGAGEKVSSRGSAALSLDLSLEGLKDKIKDIFKQGGSKKKSAAYKGSKKESNRLSFGGSKGKSKSKSPSEKSGSKGKSHGGSKASSSATELKCKKPFTNVYGYCVLISNDERKFSDAAKKCEDFGGRLLISGDVQYTATGIKDHPELKGRKVYIGGGIINEHLTASLAEKFKIPRDDCKHDLKRFSGNTKPEDWNVASPFSNLCPVFDLGNVIFNPTDCNVELGYICEQPPEDEDDLSSWTDWINVNKPDRNGEDENIHDITKAIAKGQLPKMKLCRNPIGFECRAVGTLALISKSSSNGFVLDKACEKNSIKCSNNKQKAGKTCPDFEVRYKCPHQILKDCAVDIVRKECEKKNRECVNNPFGAVCVKKPRQKTGREKIGSGYCTINSVAYELSECAARGDPHYFTLDATRYSFQGQCSYSLISTCNNFKPTENFPQFSIVVLNQKKDASDKVTFTKGFTFFLYGVKYMFHEEAFSVDGMIRNPLGYNDGKIEIVVQTKGQKVSYILKTSFCLEIKWDTEQDLSVLVPDVYKNHVEGLCGQFDGNSSNDLTVPGTVKNLSPEAFGKYYMVAGENSNECLDVTDKPVPCSEESGKRLSDKKFCGILNPNGGSPLVALVLSSPFSDVKEGNIKRLAESFDACRFDFCHTSYNDNERCHELVSIVEDIYFQLNVQNVNNSWLSYIGCENNPEVSCASKPNSKYSSEYQVYCQDTCANPFKSVDCDDPAIGEGCACLPGFLLDSSLNCVPREQCEATCNVQTVKGELLHLKDGETTVTDPCKTTVTCVKGVVTETQLKPCSVGALCVNGGKTCSCLPGSRDNGTHCVSNVMCRPGYVALGEKCYRVVSQPQTWQDAATLCGADNARLLRVDSSEDYSVITTSLSKEVKSKVTLSGATSRTIVCNEKSVCNVPKNQVAISVRVKDKKFAPLCDGKISISSDKLKISVSAGCKAKNFIIETQNAKVNGKQKVITFWIGGNSNILGPNKRIGKAALQVDQPKLVNLTTPKIGCSQASFDKMLTIVLNSNCNAKNLYICEYENTKENTNADGPLYVYSPPFSASGITSLPELQQKLHNQDEKVSLCQAPAEIECRAKVISGVSKGSWVTNRNQQGTTITCRADKISCTPGQELDCTSIEVRVLCPAIADHCEDLKKDGFTPCDGGRICKPLKNHFACLCPPGSIFNELEKSCSDACGICSAWGDPHYTTYRGKKYNFMGTCKYVYTAISKHNQLDTAPQFAVLTTNKPCGEKGASCIYRVEVRAENIPVTYGGTEIKENFVIVATSGGSTFKINGVEISQKEYVVGDVLKISMTNMLSIYLPIFGVHVSFLGSKLSVQVPGRYDLVGLCGNCKSDNFELRNGTFISVSNKGEDLSDKEMIPIAYDWRVEDPEIDSEECKLPPPLPEDRCPEEKKAEVVSECQKVFKNSSNIFGKTAAELGINLNSYNENCRYDGCLQDLKEAICNLAKAMVQQFAANGRILENWRDAAGCPMSCSGDTVYMANAACHKICGVRFTSTVACQEIPDEDCVCKDSNKWKQGNKCVPENQCGCQHYLANNTVGYFLKPNESILSSTCSDIITCILDDEGVGSLIYSANTLPVNAECITVNPGTPPKVECAKGFSKEPKGDKCSRNPKECKQGYQKIGDQCLYKDKANSWREAVQECNEKGGYLIDISNDASEDLLRELLKKHIKIEAYIAGRVKVSSDVLGNKFNEVLKANEKGRIEYANYDCEDHLRKKISLSPRLNPISILNNEFNLAIVAINDNGQLVYHAVTTDTPASFICKERNITDDDTKWYPPCNNDDNMSDDGDQELRSDLILKPDCLLCPIPIDIECVPNPNRAILGEVEGTCSLNDGVYYSCNEGDACIDKGVSLRCVKDIDECASGIHECPENSECVNTIGAYSCVCNKEFPVKINGKCYGVDTCVMSGPPTLFDYVYTIKGFSGVSGQYSYDCQYNLAKICDYASYNPSSGLPYISFYDLSARNAGVLEPYISGSVYNPRTDRSITWAVKPEILSQGLIMIGRNNSEPVLTSLSFTDSETNIKFQYTDGCGLIIQDINNHFTAKITFPMKIILHVSRQYRDIMCGLCTKQPESPGGIYNLDPESLNEISVTSTARCERRVITDEQPALGEQKTTLAPTVPDIPDLPSNEDTTLPEVTIPDIVPDNTTRTLPPIETSTLPELPFETLPPVKPDDEGLTTLIDEEGLPTLPDDDFSTLPEIITDGDLFTTLIPSTTPYEVPIPTTTPNPDEDDCNDQAIQVCRDLENLCSVPLFSCREALCSGKLEICTYLTTETFTQCSVGDQLKSFIDDLNCVRNCGNNMDFKYTVKSVQPTCANPILKTYVSESFNFYQGFGCVCSDNYLSSGISCVHKSQCGCKLPDGSFKAYGSQWRSTNCGEVNTCLTNNVIDTKDAPCGENTHCEITANGPTCKCNEDYYGNPDMPDGCQEGTQFDDKICYNYTSSYGIVDIKCVCKQGYASNCDTCIDIDECREGLHDCDLSVFKCNNVPGGYECLCNDGYEERNGQCIDVNECLNGTAVCPPNSQCVNKEGGHGCICCTGYTWNSESQICDRDLITYPSLPADAKCCATCSDIQCEVDEALATPYCYVENGQKKQYPSYKKLYQEKCISSLPLLSKNIIKGSCPPDSEPSSGGSGATPKPTVPTTCEDQDLCNSLPPPPPLLSQGKVCGPKNSENPETFDTYCDLLRKLCRDGGGPSSLPKESFVAATPGECPSGNGQPKPVQPPSQPRFTPWTPFSGCIFDNPEQNCGQGTQVRNRQVVPYEDLRPIREVHNYEVSQNQPCFVPCKDDGNGSPTSQCPVPSFCGDGEPVCGSVGVGAPKEFKSECELNVTACESDEEPIKLYSGPCDLEDGSKPQQFCEKAGPKKVSVKYDVENNGLHCIGQYVEIGSCESLLCDSETDTCCTASVYELIAIPVQCYSLETKLAARQAVHAYSSATKCNCQARNP